MLHTIKKLAVHKQKKSFSKFFILKSPSTFIAMVILFLLFFMAIFGPYMNHHTYYSTHLELKNSSPSSTFWFGTDDLGRDVFTRTWWGARISLLIGITATVIDVFIGIFWGTFAGWKGGKIDETMMRICDILYAIPYLLVVILFTVILGHGISTIIFSLTLTGWINMARIVRGQILQMKKKEFIQAITVLGASKMRIFLHHLIPNAMGPIITTMTLTIPTAIFTEAFLSFLGLGVQAPIASWGVMINESLSAMRYYPWRLFFPALFITLTIFSLNLLGNSLQDFLNPKYKEL